MFPSSKQWKKWSLPSKLTAIGAYVGVFGIVLSVVLYLMSDAQQQRLASEGEVSPEARAAITNLLDLIESVPSSLPHGLDDIVKNASKELSRDPYNVRALLVRAQMHYTDARASGGKGYREALADFERAKEVDKQLADPSFGIGTVLYHLAIFDLTKRGRFRIHSKGAMRMNKESGLPEMRYPSLEFFVDDRCRLVLQVALNNFEAGRKLRQDFRRQEGATILMFAPSDVEDRIRSIRGLLGYEPVTSPDAALVSVFSTFLSRLEPKSFEDLFEIEAKQREATTK